MDFKTLFISIYMPFFDAAKRDECLLETIDAISMLDEMLNSHPHHDVVIGGDLNTELKGISPFDPLWNEFILKNELICCDNFISTPNTYTYSHDTLGQQKWNDHFLISKRLSTATKNHFVLDEGENPSDHLPLLFSLPIPLSAELAPPVETPVKQAKLRWDKLTAEQRSAYEQRLSHILETSPSPLSSCECQQSSHCNETNCRNAIQDEYDSIVKSLKAGSKV